MKKATLKHDDIQGFILVDENENFIITVKVGDLEGDIDWNLVEKQANEKGFTLD